MAALLLVGRVARAHGNRGQVIVNPETDFAEERFRAGRTLLVGPESGAQPRTIRDVRFHQGRPIVALDGIETMNDAEALAGAELWIAEEEAGALPANTFYRHDLVGCEVVDAGGMPVGTVASVEGTLERSYLIVRGRRGDVMIPMTAEIVAVDITAKRITINPPEGLLELNEREGPRA
jgi:16S rRNA processing protein RimM